MPENPKRFLIASFDDDEKILDSVRKVREAGVKIYDVYSPYPIHGMDEAMGIDRRTRLPRVTLVMGLMGTLTALGLQFFCAVWDWPINVGGKPANSTLAFVPITFELTILFGGLSTAAALFFRAGLFPGRSLEPLAMGATEDRFAAAVWLRDDAVDEATAKRIFQEGGAVLIEEKEVRR